MFSVEQRTEDELNSNSPEIASVEIARDRATIKDGWTALPAGCGREDAMEDLPLKAAANITASVTPEAATAHV